MDAGSIHHALPATDPSWAELASLSSDMLVLLDAQSRIAWVNDAFERRAGIASTDALGRTLDELLRVDGDTPWEGVRDALSAGRAVPRTELPWRLPTGETGWGVLTARPLPPGSAGHARIAVCLQDVSTQYRLAELLETAQEFGRLGLWERKIPSGEGRWDRHVFRFFGMDPSAGTPHFDEAARRIHPDDRSAADYPKSTLKAGRYEARYRVLQPGGGVLRLHSLWEVKNSPAGVPDRTVGIMVDDTNTYALAQAFNDTSEQLRLAVDLGNIAIWRHDLRTDRIHYNHRAYQVLGIEPRPEGLTIDEVRSLIHPDDRRRVAASANEALATGRPTDHEARYRRSDGRWRHVLVRLMLRRDALGQPLEFLGVGLDVTEQVERTHRATELAERLEIAAAAAGIGVFIRDHATGEGEWNAEMFRLMRRSPQQGVPGRSEWVEQTVHPDDRAMMHEANELLDDPAHDRLERQYRAIMPDGEVRWLVNRARRVQRDGHAMIYGITLDVTERLRTEAALRSANERVALTAHSVGLGTWEWDPATDETIWDDQMFRLRGRSPQPEAPNARRRAEMAHPEDVARVEALLADAVARRRHAAYEFRVVWPDGSVHWLASRSTPVEGAGADGASTRYIGVNWDITDAVSAEAARREKLVAQRESEAKSQFLARMSHELRTPLNAVLGFAQLLRIDAATSPVQADRAEHIVSAGEHLLSLINDVLDLSSLESGQLKLSFEEVSLSPLVSESLPMVDDLARRLGVSIRVGEVDGHAWADRVRLRQVLINLLSNAIKYNRQGGEVHVEGHVRDGVATLAVRDTGRGLSEQQQRHLFEPFNRLGIESEGIEGTGIGLAIVKTLVACMGGSIDVRSAPGQGSLFEVRLKATVAGSRPEEPPAQHSPADRGQPAQRARLLYIEDNPVNILLVQELVATRPGLALECEMTGERGVERAQKLRPDLILVDMHLPDFDGFEVLRRLRASPGTASIPCIAVTANAMPDNIARALAAGFAQYWTKPIDFAAFMSAIEDLLRSRP